MPDGSATAHLFRPKLATITAEGYGLAPLAALAGLLLVVCWNMAEKAEFAHLLGSRPTAIVLLATFGLTLAADLTVGIVAGCLAAAAIRHFDCRTG
jgi:MFS superfamily sulfate permease-like transporter